MAPRDRRRASWLAVAAVAVALSLPGCSAVADHLLTPGRATTPRRAHQVADLDAGGSTPALELMPRRGAQAAPAKPKPSGPGETQHVSPDGQWVAVESRKGTNRILTVGRRESSGRRVIGGGHPAAAPSWAPDSRHLVYSAREFRDPDVWVIWLLDVSTLKTVKLGSAGGVRPPAVAWFPGGDRICYGNEDRLVLVSTTTREAAILQVPERGRVAGRPAVSPDGRRIGFAVSGAGAWVASVEDGALSRLTTDREVDALAWAPGGREVALRTASDGRWQVKSINK
ncbi:MAG: hypothetical protein ACM3NQ_23935 [Bacteroidales bacterium]